jgi:predicted dienelactone hydrolase
MRPPREAARTPAAGAGTAADTPQPLPSLADPRVRAVVAMAPVGVVPDPASLRRIDVPVALYGASDDRWLVPRLHLEPLAAAIPRASVHRIAGAGHFAFADTPTAPIPTPGGDVGADPPGFDRAAFLERLAEAVGDFIDRALEGADVATPGGPATR